MNCELIHCNGVNGKTFLCASGIGKWKHDDNIFNVENCHTIEISQILLLCHRQTHLSLSLSLTIGATKTNFWWNQIQSQTYTITKVPISGSREYLCATRIWIERTYKAYRSIVDTLAGCTCIAKCVSPSHIIIYSVSGCSKESNKRIQRSQQKKRRKEKGGENGGRTLEKFHKSHFIHLPQHPICNQILISSAAIFGITSVATLQNCSVVYIYRPMHCIHKTKLCFLFVLSRFLGALFAAHFSLTFNQFISVFLFIYLFANSFPSR